jgi:hypothetical protein
VRVGLAQVLDQLDPLPVGEREVHDPQVGLAVAHHLARFGDRPGLRHDLEIRLPFEDQRERLPERGVVFD